MQALRQFGEKLNTAIPTVQSKVELERSNIDSTDGLVASQPRSRSGFSVKTILAVEDLERFALYTNLQRRRIWTKKKQRPMFSQQQVKAIENELAKHRYITENKRTELSSTLNPTEMQVKTWFQNRRTQWRKDLKNKET
ncbi:unnamed protein product [Porites evermanni]|uniref:Homeobox domain-containing protein n=1 Tax=Porites evermanni TaxID=104178 RepID=A0ABN8LIA0_9CNID|nr:unnamed protein product [Porites evermanni]